MDVELSKKKRNLIIISSIAIFVLLSFMIASIVVIHNERHKRRLISNYFNINLNEITKIEIINYQYRYNVTDINSLFNDLMNIEVKPKYGEKPYGVYPAIQIYVGNENRYYFSDAIISSIQFKDNYSKMKRKEYLIYNEKKIKELFDYYLNNGSITLIDS